MKKINKYLSLMLGMGMVISAASCGKKNGGFDMNETDADVTEITILAGDMDTYQTDGVDKNTPVYQALKAAVGFDVYAQTGVSNAQLPEKIKLLHSTGALPEIFRIHGPYNSSLYQYLIEEEAMVAIDKYVNETTKDIYPYLYEHMKQFDYMKSNVTYANGHNHWTFRIGACQDILSEWNMMLGYRNYSDGFIYSDCVRATARYMFARTGDDGIEVKALGSYGGYKDTIPMATDVLFEKCTVWNDSAAALGVIYENYKPIDGVVFRDCSVGFSTCSWSPNNSALNIRLAYPGTAHWKNITFENIEIFECYKNAFTLEWNLQGGSVENVLLKDITVRNAQAAIRVNVDTDPVLPYESLTQLCKNFVFENFTFMGVKLTDADKENVLYFSYTQPVYKDLFTIK